jgi:hypothetical protein
VATMASSFERGAQPSMRLAFSLVAFSGPSFSFLNKISDYTFLVDSIGLPFSALK